MIKKNRQKGFAHILAAVAIVVLVIFALISFRVYSSTKNTAKEVVSGSPVTEVTKNDAPVESEVAQRDDSHVTAPKPDSSPKEKSSPEPVPAPSPTKSIQVNGDADCQSSTKDALDLIAEKAPAHYSVVVKYVAVIECQPQGSGMFAYENPPRYVVGDMTRNGGTVWFAGTIVHDAGHSKLYNDYLSSHPNESVPDNIWTGEGAERTCLEAQYDALTKIGGSQDQLDSIRSAIDTQYWNVPYDQRWW